MTNYEKIYWLTRLDSVKLASQYILTCCAVFLIMWIFIRHIMLPDFNDEDGLASWDKKVKWWRRVSISLLIIAIPVLVFLPSKNEMLLIMAGGKTLDFVQKDSSLNKIPSQTTAIISEYLDKSLKELKEEK